MILITGGNGFIGTELISSLDEQELIVCGRVRPEFVTEDKFRYLDLSNIIVERDFFDSVNTIIHCAARVNILNDESSNLLDDYRKINTVATLKLAKQAAKAGIKRFIFISSIKVNGEESEFDRPFKFSDARHPEDFYGQSKSEAEEQLLQLAEETGLEVVIIRPTLVYGPGVKANFASLMNLVSKGIPLPFGSITDNKRSLVSVNNLVDLIITCIDHPKAVNQVFLVSDDHDISTSEIVYQMARSLDKIQWQIPLPLWCYKFFGKVLGKQVAVQKLIGSLQVDITHTKETLGWNPPQRLEDAFSETAKVFLKSQKK